MAIELKKHEIELLDKADDELSLYGKTNLKCPRCKNEIIIEDAGTSYTVRCKTDNCISLDYRGI
jgi:formamidopyrimidine-DNA glycosylase